MRSSTLEIFATPEEQWSWLQGAAEADAWCVHERPRVGRGALVNVNELSIESLGNEHSSARLFLGRSDLLHPPVWTGDGVDMELDFVRSQAVLFEPAVQAKRALIAGRLAIMNRREYDDAEVPFAPLQRWYSALCRSLGRALSVPSVKLIVTAPSMPPADVRGSYIVSEHAVALARAGVVLKQFRDSRVFFEIA